MQLVPSALASEAPAPSSPCSAAHRERAISSPSIRKPSVADEVSWQPRVVRSRSLSNLRLRSLQCGQLAQEIFKRSVQRLVTLHFRIPTNSHRQYVPAFAFRRHERREIHFQTFFVLFELQPPAVHRSQRRPSQKSLRIFQMFIAKKNLFPRGAFIFKYDRASNQRALRRNSWRSRLQAVYSENLLWAAL